MIGKRKFALLLIFILVFSFLFLMTMFFRPDLLTADTVQGIYTIFGVTVATGLGAMGVENVAKYGMGKRSREEVEP